MKALTIQLSLLVILYIAFGTISAQSAGQYQITSEGNDVWIIDTKNCIIYEGAKQWHRQESPKIDDSKKKELGRYQIFAKDNDLWVLDTKTGALWEGPGKWKLINYGF